MLGKKIPVTRWAMTIGLGSSLLALGATYAQEVSNPTSAVAPETGPVQKITITGSNIPTSEDAGASAVDVVDQAARDRTGQEDVLTVLTQATPAISSGGGNIGQSNASIASGGTLGGSAISVHGLQTLVLLNGRRLTDASAAAAGGGSFTDVNLFPSALVKRIEVLKDGASAIYGTEAVGGVVNVILDQEFQGFEFSARYGFTEKADVQDQRYSGIFGFGDAHTHVVIGAEYVEQDPIFNRQRDFSQPSFATTTYAGIIRVGGQRYALNGGLNSPTDVNAANPGAATAVGGLTAGTYIPQSAAQVTNGFDLSRATTITLDQNRLNFFGSADRELIGKHVVAFADFLYASNYSQSQLNAQPLSNAQVFDNGGQSLVIPATAPFNPLGRTADGSTVATNANQYLVNNRFIAAPRVFRQDTDFWRVVAGLKGEIIPNYNYEVALNSSRDELSFKNFNLVNGFALNQAIAGGYDANGNPQVAGAQIPGAAPGVVYPAGTINGPFSVVGGNLQPALDFFARTPSAASLNGVFGTDIRYFETKFFGLDGKITAFPFTLPGGPVGFAAGGEWRHETLKANLDPQTTFIGSVPIGNLNVGRDVTAGFAEVQIPVIGPDMKIPFLYSLDLNGAVRYEDYNPGNSTWVPKVGFVLRPIKDIALRGTFSKSFIAPTLYQTQGPASSGFSSSIDLGAGPEQAQETGGSNPALGNIRADTYTAGLVISPHMVPGLTLNADFFHVEETNLIGSIDDTLILQSVNTLGASSPFAGLVHSGSFTGPAAVTGNAPGQLTGNLPVTYVVDNTQNLGGLRIAGVDFGAHYNHDFGMFGQVALGIDGTYYLQYKQQSFNFSPFYDVLGYYQGQAAEVADYHLTPSVEYRIQGFSASALMNYTPSVRDAHNVSLDPSQGGYNINKFKPLPKIRDYYNVNLLFAYEFHYNPPVPAAPMTGKDGKDGKGGGGKEMMAKTEPSLATDSPLKFLDGLKLSFGINNVTNARPPLIVGSPDSTNTDASIYDPYQRQYYFVITKKF